MAQTKLGRRTGVQAPVCSRLELLLTSRLHTWNPARASRGRLLGHGHRRLRPPERQQEAHQRTDRQASHEHPGCERVCRRKVLAVYKDISELRRSRKSPRPARRFLKIIM